MYATNRSQRHVGRQQYPSISIAARNIPTTASDIKQSVWKPRRRHLAQIQISRKCKFQSRDAVLEVEETLVYVPSFLDQLSECLIVLCRVLLQENHSRVQGVACRGLNREGAICSLNVSSRNAIIVMRLMSDSSMLLTDLHAEPHVPGHFNAKN